MIAAWSTAAKLGIFVHWGVYSVDGVAESWSFFDRPVPYDDYTAQLVGFTAARFDGHGWAEPIARAGAAYAVLTAKHLDGVALYDTRVLRPERRPPHTGRTRSRRRIRHRRGARP